MIKIDIQRKSFGDQVVLENIELEIRRGTTVAVLGPSGIGKTTLLRIAIGADEDFQGQVQVPERISMIFQEPTLLPWRTAIENITLLSGTSKADALEALDRLDLTGKADQYPRQLSLGQQRRLSLARAIAAEPEFLVMDEPFTSLDEALVDEMLGLTQKIIRQLEIPTLIVTHSRSEAAFLADKIMMLDGKPASLRRFL